MNFPSDFINNIQTLLKDESEQLMSSLNGEAEVSIRLNPYKLQRNPIDFSVSVEKVPWSENGYYLNQRPAFTFDPLFHSGYYYVQEASSLFVDYVVRQLVSESSICLDLSAAPGGKSLGLLTSLPENSLLVSNEIVRLRANVLSESLIKFGNPNILVTNNSPKDFTKLTAVFDLILVDAPCSGEGMFRKDKQAIEEWSVNNVKMCASRQKDILREIWPALKVGGVLIYSTCTYNLSENEDNALWAFDELGAEFVEIEVDPEWKISPSFISGVPAYRFFPHKTNGEGLFVTILKKPDVLKEPDENQFNISSNQRFSKRKNSKSSFTVLKENEIRDNILNLINNQNAFEFVKYENSIIAITEIYSDIIKYLSEQLKIVSIGVELGRYKGYDFIPSHSLAMNKEINKEHFFSYEVSYDESIAYLRNQTIQLADAPKGFILLTYMNEPIGFVKNLGNRANNLYPKEWRIKSGYLPEKSATILSK
mgnify:FL=1